MMLLLYGIANYAQQAFNCEGQVYAIDRETMEISSLVVDPANNSVRINPLFSHGEIMDALGFNPLDNLLYGVDPLNYHLYRIDATGAIENLTTLAIPNNLAITAGAISNDGQFFYVVGSLDFEDQLLFEVNLTSYTIRELINLGGNTFFTDLAFDPYTDELYGCDQLSNGLGRINLSQGAVSIFNVLKSEDQLHGIYFDAFGRLLGYGTTANGVATGLFDISKTEIDYRRISTGPFDEILDIASCPFTVAIQNAADPQVTFPCAELIYNFSVANPSETNYNNIDLRCQLPGGVTFLGFDRRPNTGSVSGEGTSVIRVNNMTITPGISDFSARINVDDVPKETYRSQTELTGFPAEIGFTKLSDDPVTASSLDSTKFLVNRIDESELEFSQLMCLGTSIVLDGSQFGGNLNWIGGGTGPTLEVDEPGTYGFVVDSGCTDLEVSYEVVGASCPYVIELHHLTEPAESFACSEVIFRYIFENESGLEREEINLIDTIGHGFEFIELLTELETGNLESTFPSDNILISGITLKEGLDTIDFKVYIGDVIPGDYFNRSMINGFHPEIGISRISDDPRTQLVDSTKLVILGTPADSTYIDMELCNNETLDLNGNQYGLNLTWEDGSTDSIFTVNMPGIYELMVFDGCEDAHVFFVVEEADGIDLSAPQTEYDIHVGDSIYIEVFVDNQGIFQDISWTDPLENTLRCDSCLGTYTRPFNDVEYTVHGLNEICRDSLIISVKVDKTRRVYIPNIFSPNEDGINECFFIQSPDYGDIRQIEIYDRWGGLRFESTEMIMNEPTSCWSAYENGRLVSSGVYTYFVEIEFIDGEVEVFTGTVTLIH